MSVFQAGVAGANITPPLGVPLTGFGGRKGPAEDVHDDLQAKALVLDDGTTKLALITADVLGWDFDLVERIRTLVQQRTGIPDLHVMLNASHTHSGPATISLRGLGERDETYCDVTVRKIVGAVIMAMRSRQPARLGIGREPVQIGFNRREKTPQGEMILGRNPAGPVAPWVDILRLDTADGRPLACFFSHAAHPVTQRGLTITRDYCGYAVDFVERAKEGVQALFAQGCGGNVNCDCSDLSWAGTERLGTILGAAVVKGWEMIETTDQVVLDAAVETIELPLQNPPSVEEAEALLQEQEKRLQQAQADDRLNEYQLQFYGGLVEWAQDYLRLAQEGEKERTQKFEIQAFVLNRTAIVAYPGEMFVEYQLFADAHSPFEHTIALGYSNGCIGYVPTAAAYPLGGYEVETAYRYYGTLMLQPDCERLIQEATLQLLEVF